MEQWIVAIDMDYYPYILAFDSKNEARAVYDRYVAAATDYGVYLAKVLDLRPKVG